MIDLARKATISTPSYDPDRISVLLVSSTRKGNGLGRAISLSEALVGLARTFITAYDDGPLWRGARNADIRIEPFRNSRQLMKVIDSSAGADRLIVWSVKPLPWSYWPVRRCADGRSGKFTHLLDVDDHDAALSREFRASKPHHRAILHPAHPLDPRRIERVLHNAPHQVSGISGSSATLLAHLGIGARPTITIIPHMTPRALVTAVENTPLVPRSQLVRLGFIGTARRHKGISVLLDLLKVRPDLELHVIHDEMTPELLSGKRRVVAHATAAEAYANTDVVALPQDANLLGSRYQLPAKMLDALRFGKPVLVTPTPVIVEHARDAVSFVHDWQDHSTVFGLLDEAFSRLPELALRGQRVYAERFSANALRPGIMSFISTVCSPGD